MILDSPDDGRDHLCGKVRGFQKDQTKVCRWVELLQDRFRQQVTFSNNNLPPNRTDQAVLLPIRPLSAPTATGAEYLGS